MNKTALLFGVGASLILAAGAANAAGSCGAQVAELQQKLGTEEGANATIGATDPGVQQPSPSASVDPSTSTTTTTDGSTTTTTEETTTTTDGSATTADTSTSADGSSMPTNNENSGANATIGPTDPGVQQPQDMGATADSSDSSTTTTDSTGSTTADSSTTAMPSGDVTETSRVGDMSTSAGGRAEAITALKKAQLAADAGDEDACMAELGTAKAALGVE
jgi:hypothetical protein